MKTIIFGLVVISAGFASAQDCSSGTCRQPVRTVVSHAAGATVSLVDAAFDATEHVVATTACAAKKSVAYATRPAKRVFAARKARCCR